MAAILRRNARARTVAYDETEAVLAHEPALRERFGITRIANLTHLDRIAVPVVCAVVPESRDDVSIYGGRGITLQAARCAALMETVERQTAVECILPERTQTPARTPGIDLVMCGLKEEYADTPMPFVPGVDIVSGAPLLLPKALVQMPWRGAPAFPATHTNGLAAGAAWDSAIVRALLEVIERHLWALVHARAHLRPKHMLGRLFGAAPMAMIDDPVEELQLPCGQESVDGLWKRCVDSGSTLRVVVMRESDLPIAMTATLCERSGGTPRVHTGSGCAWSATDAALGAITEAVQCRVADTQAARENILRRSDPPARFAIHTRRRSFQPYGRWYFDGPTRKIMLADLPAQRYEEPGESLSQLLKALVHVAPAVAIVTLSPPGAVYHVVRAIVPQLESFLADGRYGAAVRAIVEHA